MNGRMKTLSAVLAVVALIGLVTSGMTVSDVLGAKSYYEQKDIESTENLTKLDDGLATLLENEQAYLDGRDALADGYAQYEAGQQTLADGYAAYEQGQQDYADGQAKLAQGAKDLAAGRKGVQQMEDGIDSLTAPDAYPTWRKGFEAAADAGYVKNGNVDLAKAASDKAQLEQAIPAYEGVTGLEKNGATPEQAQAMAVAGVMQKTGADQATAAAMVSNALTNADAVKAVHAAVDKLVAGYSDDEAFATAEAGVLAAMKADGAPEAYQKAAAVYEAVDGAMDQGASLDEACEAVALAQAIDSVRANTTAMAQIEAAAATYGLDPESDPVAYEAFIDQQVEALAATHVTEDAIATVKGAYNQVLSQINAKKQEILDCKDDQDAAIAFVAASQGKTVEEIESAYAGYDIVDSYERLQKPTSEGGITHAEAVAAVAASAGVSTGLVETAYQTITAMGGTAAAQANINTLSQMPALKSGRSQMQSALNTLLTKVAGNKDLVKKAKAAGVDLAQLKALLNGTDKQFETAVDTIIALAPGLLEAAQDAVDEGQAAYDQGVEDLAAGAAKLAAAEQQLAEGEAALADAAQQLADGEAQLAEFEDGVAQVEDGLDQVIATEADPGLVSIAERLGADYTYEKDNGDLDIQQGMVAMEAAWAYKADSGEAIGNELYPRVYAAVAAILASLAALIAAFLGFKKKYKGALPCAAVSTVAAAAAAVIAANAGMYFSHAAGSTMNGGLAIGAGAALAVVALVHAIADGVAKKAA